MPKLVSIDQAAEALAVSPRTIRRRIAEGSLRAYRIGPRAIRVDRRDIDGILRPVRSFGGDAA